MKIEGRYKDSFGVIKSILLGLERHTHIHRSQDELGICHLHFALTFWFWLEDSFSPHSCPWDKSTSPHRKEPSSLRSFGRLPSWRHTNLKRKMLLDRDPKEPCHNVCITLGKSQFPSKPGSLATKCLPECSFPPYPLHLLCHVMKIPVERRGCSNGRILKANFKA